MSCCRLLCLRSAKCFKIRTAVKGRLSLWTWLLGVPQDKWSYYETNRCDRREGDVETHDTESPEQFQRGCDIWFVAHTGISQAIKKIWRRVYVFKMDLSLHWKHCIALQHNCINTGCYGIHVARRKMLHWRWAHVPVFTHKEQPSYNHLPPLTPSEGALWPQWGCFSSVWRHLQRVYRINQSISLF